MEYEYCENPDKDKLPNENDKKYLQYSEILMQAKEAGVGYRVEKDDTLYLVPTPIVRIDEENRWHSDKEPAISWKEGEKFYYLHGVSFPEKLWKEVTSGKMPFEDILKIADIDQRTQAMRFGDLRKFLEHTNAKKLSESMKVTSKKAIKYELYEIPSGEIFTENVKYVVYNCPSTDKEYMSGVPAKMKTVAEAMAWKLSNAGHIVSPKEWESLVPLETES